VLLLSRTGLVLSPLPVFAGGAFVAPIVMLINYAEAVKRGRVVVREGELRYERLVENVNDAIIMTDAKGRLVFANRRFREWFGLEGRDIRAVAPEDFVAPEWRTLLQDLHQRWMRGEKPASEYEYEGLKPDGTRIWIEALATAIEEDGRITGTQAALRDVTERKRIEAQYLQAQKMESIGRLAGIVAHDFNNLLTVINGYCDLMLMSWPETNAYSSSVEEIRAAGERAADLTRNLLAFSRKQHVQPKALDLNSIVAESEKMFRRLLGEDIQLIARLSPGLGYVRADAGQVHQVLMNLLVNGRDAMPRGGTVVIETRNEAGDSVYLGVTDSGTGMSDEVKRHLFEPFYTTKEPGKGTGLGLATVFGIVEQSAGKIEVSSTPGKGTTFHIYWPRAEAERVAETGANGRADSPQGSATVLVVEDQDAVRRYVRAVLEQSGCRVLEASNGPDALALVESFPETIQLLLTDLIMPLMNGRELADRLQALRPSLKVLFMSGYEEETIGSHGIVAADLAFLAKPFRPEELMAKVRETLVDSAAPRSRPQSA
jgi:PAS domain S-box-containing protein